MDNKKKVNQLTECPECGGQITPVFGVIAGSPQSDEEIRIDLIRCDKCDWEDHYWDYFDTY